MSSQSMAVCVRHLMSQKYSIPQDCCSRNTIFLKDSQNFVNEKAFLVAYYYKNCRFLLQEFVNKKAFLVAYYYKNMAYYYKITVPKTQLS